MPKFQRLCIYANYQQFKKNAALPYQSLFCGFSPQYVELRVVFSTKVSTRLHNFFSNPFKHKKSVPDFHKPGTLLNAYRPYL